MEAISRLPRVMLVVTAVVLSMGPTWEITTPSPNCHVGYNETVYGGGTGAASASCAFNAYKGEDDFLNGETGNVDSYGNWDLIIDTPANGWNETESAFFGRLKILTGGQPQHSIVVVFDGMPPP